MVCHTTLFTNRKADFDSKFRSGGFFHAKLHSVEFVIRKIDSAETIATMPKTTLFDRAYFLESAMWAR